jgi:soluble lytic murein transglycosylase-like protein
VTVLEAQARIAEIRGLLGLARPAPASSSAFADTLRSTVDSSAAAAATPVPAARLSGADAVAAARRYLGTPYTFGSNTPESGLDCSGLVQRAYADLGVQLPRTAREQARAGTAVPSLAQARPGDLLAFGRPVDHIGIYAGGGRMIVAPHTGDVVKLQPVPSTPTAIRRIVPGDVPALRPAALASSAPASAAPASSALASATLASPAPAPAAAASSTWGPAKSTVGSALPSSVPYADLFQATGTRYGLSPTLLAAVAKVESGFNPKAVSRAGALGLMQLMPATARGLGVDALNPPQAVDGAARVLSSHLKRFGSLDLALAAYNAGGGAVHRYGGIPPFPQTQAYVPKVKAAMAQLSHPVTTESAAAPSPALTAPTATDSAAALSPPLTAATAADSAAAPFSSLVAFAAAESVAAPSSSPNGGLLT